MPTAILLLFAHWVGDYLLQTNEMASRKAASLKWLTVHVLVYCIPILCVSILLFPVPQALVFLAVNGVLHWITDFFTSRLAIRYKSNPRVFHSIVGFDQFIHAACLLGTTEFF
jgi:hypothetical protein